MVPAGDVPAAASGLDRALGLWQGPALADLDSDRLRARGRALDRERTAALELRAQADVLLGRFTEAVAQLEELVAADPLREDLHALLMRAFYGAGRQADAIAAFHRASRALREEIGVAPGRLLRSTMRAVLEEDLQLA
ncbi:AfsR/SARP family transcriptional regulator [Streptomyces sp. NPDC021356]|uniref:AfsR/SARP family transcriptional regulator n=1 Tax=Streptomyces sp. NPDC021356 TaxID=3154900 RepID=UPI0033C07C0E